MAHPVRIHSDSMAAVTYINEMGCIKSQIFDEITKVIWLAIFAKKGKCRFLLNICLELTIVMLIMKRWDFNDAD